MKVMVFGASGLIGDGIVQESLQADRRHRGGNRRPQPAERAAPETAAPSAQRLPRPQRHQPRTGRHRRLLLGARHLRRRREPTGLRTHHLQLHDGRRPHLRQNQPRGDVRLPLRRRHRQHRTGPQPLARVKGRTENAVIATLPNGYALRPGFVQPSHDMRSKTTLYRWATTALAPIAPLLLRALPAYATSTRQIGRAALHLARHGHPERVLESRDIAAAGQRP